MKRRAYDPGGRGRRAVLSRATHPKTTQTWNLLGFRVYGCRCADALERFFSLRNHLHICILWIQTLDFPLGVWPPGLTVKKKGQKKTASKKMKAQKPECKEMKAQKAKMKGECLQAKTKVHICILWIQTLDFPLGVCGGLATPCAPRSHSPKKGAKENSIKADEGPEARMQGNEECLQGQNARK